ncbi:MAG: AMP-binding protein, partial [Actinomycetota bacterium]
MSSYVWEPTSEYVDNANVTRFMRRHGIDDYHELVRRSQDDIEWFWDAVVKDIGIEFFEPYSKVLDASEGIAWPKWFVGGKVNIAHNCVDRHATSARAGKPALVWEGEDGATRTVTYSKLAVAVSKVAGGLKALGVGAGDTVGIYMPMVPEAVVAAYACAKIGAVYLPIFSGFGAPAVSTRLNDAEAKVLFTADGFWRRGQRVEMKKTADEAVAESPSIENVIVSRRFADADIPRRPKDVSWADAFRDQVGNLPAARLDSEAPFMIAYTSGTTGTPKGSVHVHGGFLVKIAQEVAYQLDVKADDLLYWVTDMGRIMGPLEMVGGHAAGAAVFMYEGAPNHPAPDRLW